MKDLQEIKNRNYIKDTKILEYDSGIFDNFKDFVNNFILPRIPDNKIILEWHKMLMEYVDDDRALYFVRTGNTSGSLRRGFLTTYSFNGKEINIVFSDNDLAAILYNLVLGHYCPTKNEFINFVNGRDTWKNICANLGIKNSSYKSYDDDYATERLFLNLPVHFNQYGGSKHKDDKYEGKRNAAPIRSVAPCIGDLGYKHCHIIDAGESYHFKGKCLGMADIKESYITIGAIDDYKWDAKISNYIRKISLNSQEEFNDIKTLAKACTLRFIDPINHFLAPKAQHNTYFANGDAYSDVGEYEVLTSFMAKHMQGVLNDQVAVDEFYKKALIEFNYVDRTSEDFHIIYYLDRSNKKKVKAKTSTKPKKSASSSTKDNGQYMYNSRTYNKRQLVLAVISDYAKTNKVDSYDDLQKVFTYSFVKNKINAKGRVTVHKDSPIYLNNGDVAYVYTEMTLDLINKFINICKTLGIIITKA